MQNARIVLLLWSVFSRSVCSYQMKYIYLAQQLTVVREACVAWKQDPEVNLPPTAALRMIVEDLQRQQSWCCLSQRAHRKRMVLQVLSVKLTELRSATTPEDLSEDFDESLLKAVYELESLSYRPTIGHLMRFIIG